MIKSITLAALIATTPAHAGGSGRMDFGLGALVVGQTTGADKVGHLGAGAFISGGVRKLGGSRLTGCLIGTGAGIIKELADHVGDPEDAIATALGACAYWKWKF